MRLLLRSALALLLVAVAVTAAAFFVDRPGRVEILWQGWQIETSVGVLVAAAALLAALVAALALLVATLRRLPGRLRRRRAARRRRMGEAALTRGLVALAAGQAAAARLAAERAGRLLDSPPVALLLAAEAAQRQGDAAAARTAYTALLDAAETEFLGLRGLLGQALRAGDDGAARHLAARARRLRPDAPWLAETSLVLAARAGDWAAARDMLAGAARRQLLPAERVRHHRGVVLFELSRAAERRGALREAAGLAAKAQAAASDLAAPACRHARLLIALGRRRAAGRAIERAWRSAPHPDLAKLYLDLRPEAGPLARAAALQRLAGQNPEALESHLAIAEAALAARLWGEARHHLRRAQGTALPTAAVSAVPSRRLCLLMAHLEEGERGDALAAREWLDRAIGAPPEPCYVCRHCGGESAAWLALCPQCGGFDTLAWGRPATARRVIAAPASGAAPPILPAPEVLPPPGESATARRLPSGLASTAQ